MPWWGWQQAEKQRHAYEAKKGKPEPGRAFTAICGRTVVPGPNDMYSKDGSPCLDPTCQHCERALLNRIEGRE